MTNLKPREHIIKQKRSNTPFREYLKQCASRMPVVLHMREQRISRYPETQRTRNLLSVSEFEEQRYGFTSLGLDYNPNRSFFDTFASLTQRVPFQIAYIDPKAENCTYTEGAYGVKNCYLSFLTINTCENIFYSYYTQDNVKNVFNSVMVWDNCDIVYQSCAIIRCYKVFYSKYIVDSNTIWFSSNLVGCSECLFCEDLQQQSYCIRNQQYTKEEYFCKKQEILSTKEQFWTWYLTINQPGSNFGSHSTKGEFNIQCENVENGYFNYGLHTGRNCIFVGDKTGRKNVYDTICSDEPGPGDIFGCSNMGYVENGYMSDGILGQSLYYCFDCIFSSYCLGCVGLKNAQFCIFNKQYDKKEWFALASTILEDMHHQNVLGDFFPATFNPMYFNDTLAYMFDDTFTREEVEAEGYLRRTEKITVDVNQDTETIDTDTLSLYEKREERNGKIDRIIDPSILNKVIQDNEGNYYRIITHELNFLNKHGLPIPRIHRHERMKKNFIRFR